MKIPTLQFIAIYIVGYTYSSWPVNWPLCVKSVVCPFKQRQWSWQSYFFTFCCIWLITRFDKDIFGLNQQWKCESSTAVTLVFIFFLAHTLNMNDKFLSFLMLKHVSVLPRLACKILCFLKINNNSILQTNHGAFASSSENTVMHLHPQSFLSVSVH